MEKKKCSWLILSLVPEPERLSVSILVVALLFIRIIMSLTKTSRVWNLFFLLNANDIYFPITWIHCVSLISMICENYAHLATDFNTFYLNQVINFFKIQRACIINEQ